LKRVTESFRIAAVIILSGCALTVTRPVQDMSNTAAAIKAAREVQADTRAPELYRQANEWFFKARQEYKLKNFKEAKAYASKARHFAEEAEFEALDSGANRVSAAPPDPMSAGVEKPSHTPAAPPDGTFVETAEEQDAQKKRLELEKAAHPPSAPNEVIINNNPFPAAPNATPAPR
jgi:hypothetical protein